MSELAPRRQSDQHSNEKSLSQVKETTSQIDVLRRLCWNEARNAYGTSYIFQRRARSWTNRVQWITYIGFVVPMLIGLLVLSYGHLKSIAIIIAAAAGIGIGQAVISLWSIVGGWVSGASYAATSAVSNDLLAAKYAELASDPPSDPGELKHRYELLKVEGDARTEQDFQQGVKESEKRMGMRAGLRKYQQSCIGCKEVPMDMKASDCSVCGQYRYRIR